MIIGADPQDLLALSVDFQRAASTLELSRHRIDLPLSGAWWRGPTAEGFAHTWTTSHGPALRKIQAALRDAGRVLEQQAHQQEAVSAAELGPAFTATVGRASTESEAAATGPAYPEATSPVAKAPQATQVRAQVPDFAAVQREIRRRIRQLQLAEQHELAMQTKWFGLRGLLRPKRRLVEIRRSMANYEGLLGEGRQILLLGDGLVAEVFGDLDSARRVGVWVPGVGTDIGDFADADGLAAKRIWNSDPDLAMIEWLGYDPPDTIPEAALELGRGARRAGNDLNRFVSQIREIVPNVVIGGHSYGSVVAAYAASVGTRADGVVLAGSPGVPVADAAEFVLDGVAGSAGNVAVIENRYDPVTVGHLADELITATVGAATAPLAGVAAVGPTALGILSALVPGLLPNPGSHDPTWWSEMAHDPYRAGFGALRLPANETQLSGSLTGENHRYADPGSVSLESLRWAFRR